MCRLRPAVGLFLLVLCVQRVNSSALFTISIILCNLCMICNILFLTAIYGCCLFIGILWNAYLCDQHANIPSRGLCLSGLGRPAGQWQGICASPRFVHQERPPSLGARPIYGGVLWNSLHSRYFLPLQSNALLSTLFSKKLSLCSSLKECDTPIKQQARL